MNKKDDGFEPLYGGVRRHTFMSTDTTEYEPSEATQNLKGDEIYIYQYDPELGRTVGEWVKNPYYDGTKTRDEDDNIR